MKELKTTNDVVQATTSELLAWYNAHAGTNITKFSDRKTAERRVLALLMAQDMPAPRDSAPAALPPPPKEPKAKAKEPKAKAKAKEPKAKKKAHAPVAEDVKEKMSDAQRKSWKDDDTRAKRCERSGVSVDGEDYRSVRAAFEALGLPMSKHITFRMELKEAGKLNALDHKWEIIPLNY